ncbi:hypothetical protein B0H16DRAFT_1700420 [Mycena metata]|uniref:Uncharacterized protein n=1 Tax=Mycena metata TaxID=1033252 RepID=A0AAD7HEP3_9AGAR|nr:hypothetical protein B0H16DRAFT_1700420 [Mycena metata]
MRPTPRLSALFDTPSSPLGSPPSVQHISTTPSGAPPGRAQRSSPNSTPTRQARRASSSPYGSGGRERRRIAHSPLTTTEDFSNVGVLAARKLKLKPEGVMMLEEFCKTASSVSDVKMYAQLLKISEMQSQAQTVVASSVLSKKLENKIDIHTFRTLMSGSIPFYVKKAGPDSPSGVMKGLIQEHVGSWISQESIDDKAQWTVVSSRIRIRLTDRRYDIKKVFVDGVWITTKSDEGEIIYTAREDPLDIIKLCEALVDIVPDAAVEVTLPLLGRVALLRQILIDVNGGPKFWDKVDEQLTGLREKYDNDETRISKAIGKVLKNDCRTYGSPDLSIFT